MEKIKRELWTSLKTGGLPADDLICLVTDGENVALARADRHFAGHDVYWDACGFSGYEWEWDFEPTHWIALSVELPG